MITFTTADFNLAAIHKASKLNKALIRNTYNLFGLANHQANPPVIIEINPETGMNYGRALEILSNSGIAYRIDEEDYVGTREVRIGLRKDVRENVKLSAAIAAIVVYEGEGRLGSYYDAKFKGVSFPEVYGSATTGTTA